MGLIHIMCGHASCGPGRAAPELALLASRQGDLPGQIDLGETLVRHVDFLGQGLEFRQHIGGDPNGDRLQGWLQVREGVGVADAAGVERSRNPTANASPRTRVSWSSFLNAGIRSARFFIKASFFPVHVSGGDDSDQVASYREDYREQPSPIGPAECRPPLLSSGMPRVVQDEQGHIRRRPARTPNSPRRVATRFLSALPSSALETDNVFRTVTHA